MITLTTEEVTQALAQPGMNEFVEQCKAAGIDPLMGLAFVKELVTATNQHALNLQREYHIQADCKVHITLIGHPPQPGGESNGSTPQ